MSRPRPSQPVRSPGAPSRARVPASETTGKRMTGRIIRIVRGRACGFIRTTDGQDVFFHVSDLGQVSLDELGERLVVRFNLVADAISGPRAVQVQVARPAAAPSVPRRKRAARV